MERLTKKNSDGNYHYPKCLERCGGLETTEKCYECDFEYAVCKKLGEYEELENRLNKVYGGCDGLLSRVVEMLEKHPCIDIPNNTSKSRLLIDEDVDKWEEYKQLEEQGRLLKLPCKVGTDIYYIFGIPNEMPCTIESCVFELSDINEIGESLFLTKSEAEAKLKELRDGENE